MPTPKNSLFSQLFKRAMEFKKKKLKKPKLALNPNHPTARAIAKHKKQLDAAFNAK